MATTCPTGFDVAGLRAQLLATYERGRNLPFRLYSMTLSARNKTDCGTVMPSSRAVLRLTPNPYLLTDSIGRSRGLAPVRMR